VTPRSPRRLLLSSISSLHSTLSSLLSFLNHDTIGLDWNRTALRQTKQHPPTSPLCSRPVDSAVGPHTYTTTSPQPPRQPQHLNNHSSTHRNFLRTVGNLDLDQDPLAFWEIQLSSLSLFSLFPFGPGL
jgi:hypothetical protein